MLPGRYLIWVTLPSLMLVLLPGGRADADSWMPAHTKKVCSANGRYTALELPAGEGSRRPRVHTSTRVNRAPTVPGGRCGRWS